MTDATAQLDGKTVIIDFGENTNVAAAAALRAESAAIAAQAAAGLDEYANTAAGLAGTTEGEFFWVDNAAGIGIVYRHDAGPVATEIRRFIIDPEGTSAASLIGADDGASGTLWTKLQGFINYLMSSAGSAIVRFIHSGTGAVARTVEAKLRDFVNVKDFGATGDGVTDDTAAVLAAATAHPKLYFPSGTYRLDASNSTGLRITSGTGYHFIGDGEDTIIKRHSYNPAKACIIFDSGSASAWVTDIRFSDMKFLGDVESLGHDETYGHFISLDGVRRVLFDKCFFEGPRSDALIFGSGPGGGSERHNFDVVVRDCVFDGVIHGVDGGRNAISFIDIDGVLIEGCTFRRWSRNDMPGCIDFEPDDSFGIVKNVRIIGNDFRLCSGNRGHIALSAVNIAADNLRSFIVSNNSFDGNVALSIYTDDTVPEVFPTNAQSIVFANNTCFNMGYVINKVTGPISDIIISGNRCYGGGRINFGNGTGDFTIKKMIIVNNYLDGTVAGNIATSDKIEDVTITGNVVRGATQAHILFGTAAGSTTNVSIVGNRFIGSPTNGMCQHSSSSHNAPTNTWMNNVGDSGVTHSFRAFAIDFTGATSNQYAPSATPSSFLFGISRTTWVSHSGPTGNDTGLVETNRYNSGDIVRTHQLFWPAYSAGELAKTYYRRAIDDSTWSAWRTLTST